MFVVVVVVVVSSSSLLLHHHLSDHQYDDSKVEMMPNLQLYRRADSKEKGRHLLATEDIRKNQLIHVERPLLSLQSLGNSHQGALVCRRCGAFIGGPDICLAISSGRLDRENVWNYYKDMQEKRCVHQGYNMISCRNNCGELFCSKECEEDMWFCGGHELMCTGLIPDTELEAEGNTDLGQEAEGKAEEDTNNIDSEQNETTQEEYTMHPLLQFKVHSVQSNEIFLMVGDLVASVISRRRQQIENIVLAERHNLKLNPSRQNLDDLMAPYLDFTLIPWWEVATKPMMMSDTNNDIAVQQLDQTLKDLCSTSAFLLKKAISTLLVESSSKQSTSSNNQLFCSTLSQAMEECEEKYGVFTAEFFGKIIGSFEQNALGIRARNPICRDIIENRAFRERGKRDIFKCLQAAGVIEDNEDDENSKKADLFDEKCDQGMDEIERILASLDINEDGHANSVYEQDDDDSVNCDKKQDQRRSLCIIEENNSGEVHPDSDGNDDSNHFASSEEVYGDKLDQDDEVHGDDLDALFPPLDGTAMYYTTCKMNHSCQPNVVVKYASSCSGGGKFTRWGSNFPLVVSCCALRDIKEGEELCISYINEAMDLEDRAKALENYGFVCNCKKCVMEKTGFEAIENGSDLVDVIFQDEDDLFPEEEEDLFSGDNDTDAENHVEDTEEITSLLQVESCLNSTFSESAHDAIPINILAPTISKVLNLGNKLKRDFRGELKYVEIRSSLHMVSKLLKERSYVTALEKALDAEALLIQILQNEGSWPSLSHCEAHRFFSLSGALGHIFAFNFLPAIKLIDKAVVFGLSRAQFSHFIEYAEYQSSRIISHTRCEETRIIADFKEPSLKHLVEKVGLSNVLEYQIEQVNASSCPYEVFVKNYFSSNKPVVIRGFADTWPALDSWR